MSTFWRMLPTPLSRGAQDSFGFATRSTCYPLPPRRLDLAIILALLDVGEDYRKNFNRHFSYLEAGMDIGAISACAKGGPLEDAGGTQVFFFQVFFLLRHNRNVEESSIVEKVRLLISACWRSPMGKVGALCFRFVMTRIKETKRIQLALDPGLCFPGAGMTYFLVVVSLKPKTLTVVWRPRTMLLVVGRSCMPSFRPLWLS